MVGWPNPETNEIECSTDCDDLPSSPDHTKIGVDWSRIYTDIPYMTLDEVLKEARREAKKKLPHIRLLRLTLATWTFVSIAGAAIIGFFGPIWFSIIGLAYSLWKASSAAAELMGWKKPGKAKTSRLETERRIRHYVYHCERNPVGFQRLVRENLDEDIRQQVAEESEIIRAKATE